jgi:uncharacterized protein (TIGR03435 family)
MQRLATAALLLAQVAAQQGAAFEVASIREHSFVPGSFVGVEFHPAGRLTANAPIPLLITSAYSVVPAQLQFAPGLVDGRQLPFYTIEAKAESGAIPSGALTADSHRRMQLMLQALLIDRFKLRLHTEKKALSVYALVVDRGGLKLRKSPERDCEAMASACGWKKSGPASGITGQSVKLDSLVDVLGFFLDRSVVDRTGIADAFDINLPPFSRGAQLAGATADGVAVDVTAPSLFAVLQEAGLRLESRTELLDVYVIDHVEQPTAN